jgi:hypothetical protein
MSIVVIPEEFWAAFDKNPQPQNLSALFHVKQLAFPTRRLLRLLRLGESALG